LTPQLAGEGAQEGITIAWRQRLGRVHHADISSSDNSIGGMESPISLRESPDRDYG
jgi:hypothetical protein